MEGGTHTEKFGLGLAKPVLGINNTHAKGTKLVGKKLNHLTGVAILDSFVLFQPVDKPWSPNSW